MGRQKRISSVRLLTRQQREKGRRSLLGFSGVQCRTCRSVKRDHIELLSEQNRQAREDLLDCLTSDGGCRKVFSIKERWGNMAKFAYELPSVKMLTEYKPKCFS